MIIEDAGFAKGTQYVDAARRNTLKPEEKKKKLVGSKNAYWRASCIDRYGKMLSDKIC